MALFDKVKDSVSLASQDVAQKAKAATESVKLNNQMQSNERMIQKLVYQVGVQCVNAHSMEPGTEYDGLFQEINNLRRENQALQAQLQNINAKKVCPQCGRNNNPDAKFCVSCGAPISGAAPSAPEAGPGVACKNCGAMNPADALFCVECGTKMVSEQQPVAETMVEQPVVQPMEQPTEQSSDNQVTE